MKLFDLSGKVALVTGGNGGIGLAMAEAMAGAGADIAVAARNADKGRAAVDKLTALGVKADFIPVDVTDEASIKAMVARSTASAASISWSTTPAPISASVRRR